MSRAADPAALESAEESVVAAPPRPAWRGRVSWSLGSLVLLFVVWELAALLIQSSYFPDVLTVLETVAHEMTTGWKAVPIGGFAIPLGVADVFIPTLFTLDIPALPYHIGVTLLRVLASFVIAMLIGSAIGLGLGLSRTANQFFDSWLLFFLNLPALVIIFLCYVWFGLTEVAALTAVVLNKIPNVAIIMREGARSLSKDLAEMAMIYRFGWSKTLWHVTLPQLAPFFAAAARGGLSLVWKIVLVVELFGRSEGVGVKLNLAFQTYEVPVIFAYAICFILVVQAIELGILQPLEARTGRWRR